MRPPRVFKVIGQRFVVKTMAHLSVKDEEGQDKDLIGHTDRDGQVIMLATHVGDDKAREVYLHEAMHAITGLAGLSKGALTFDEEEDLVNRLSPILLAFIRDNPRVIEYLTGRWVGGAGSAT